MTAQDKRRDHVVGRALDALDVPAPRQGFFDKLDERLLSVPATTGRRRSWLRLTAAATAATVLALAAGLLWVSRPGDPGDGIPKAYAPAQVGPIGSAAWDSPFAGTWWFAGDKLFWLTAPDTGDSGAEEAYARVTAHVLDLETGQARRDVALTRLLRKVGWPGLEVLPDQHVGSLLATTFLPDGRVLLSRIARRIEVEESLADWYVTYWDKSRLYLAAPPYEKLVPVGPLSTWGVQPGTGGGGGGRSQPRASSEAAVWDQGGPSGGPRPSTVAEIRTEEESDASGFWACDLATGRTVRLGNEGDRFYLGTWMVRPLPTALDSWVVWAVEDERGEPPVLSDEEVGALCPPDPTPIQTYAYDVRTAERVELPVNVSDALAGDVFVGFTPSQVRFYDTIEDRLWTVEPVEDGNRVYGVAASGDLAAWIEWRTGDTRKLVVRCTDIRTRAVLTLAEVVPPPGFGAGRATCRVSVSGDRVYWVLNQTEPAGAEEWLKAYGARVWDEDGELESRLLRPFDR